MTVFAGRTNLALTVFVPYDCQNNCKFCTSKESYKTDNPSVENVKFQLNRFFEDFNYPIKDVVFTGGEPMSNITVLKDLVKIVPKEYNIYINTTLINKNLNRFVDLVNKTENIKGVNISRHSECYDEDKKAFCDIADDDKISLFEKPVRINCVLQGQDIEKVIDRWKDKGAELSFRKDFRTEMTDKELHSPYDETALKINSLGYKFMKHTFCNVCDTTNFEKDGFIVSYHKGTLNSSIKKDDVLEINDLIIKQDGFFTYDWSAEDLETIYAIEKQFKKIPKPTYPLYPYISGCGVSSRISRSYCGGSSCGGGC
jgi:MoaA/NifB/PqqE/SkfB family radical SAM enzyme